MKKLIEVPDKEAGLDSLLDHNVLLICSAYFYAGKLSGVNASFVELENAQIVYETGNWEEKGYKLAEKLPGKTWQVQRAAIESFGPGK